MAYLALARKYRPQRLQDLVGQPHVVRMLQNAIAMQRVHHAYLLTGPRGVGKTTSARILARALNCEIGPTVTPCGHCSACVQTLEGRSQDILEIDGASHTGVDNVRELRESARYLPSQARFKLYIIDEVHMLSQAAFNALLKTLEEPPPHVKFILATTEPHKIPVTILSRCQRLDFRRVGTNVLVAHLQAILAQEHMQVLPEALAQVVLAAEGSVRDALSLLEQVLNSVGDNPTAVAVLDALGVVDSRMVSALCEAILAQDAAMLLQLVADIDARGHDLAQLAELLAAHLRDVAVLKHLAEPDVAFLPRSEAELTAMHKQAAQRSHMDLQRLFALCVAIAQDVKRSSMPRISLEMGLLRLLHVAKAVDLQNLLGRLDGLVQTSGVELEKAQASPHVAVPAATLSSLKPSTPSVLAPAALPLVAEPIDATVPMAWQSFVAAVHRLRPAVAQVLEHGRVVAFGPEQVVLAYPQETFYWDAVHEPNNRAFVLQVLAERLGESVPLRIVALQPDTEALVSLAQTQEAQRQAQTQSIQESALEHLAVKQAMTILGATVSEIRPLEG